MAPVIGMGSTVYPKKYAHGFCFAVLCCGYTLTDFPISIRLTSLALWQSNDCPSASKATLMNMDKYFMWIHYERLHNLNKANHNKTVCIFLGIYCMLTCARLRYTWGCVTPVICSLIKPVVMEKLTSFPAKFHTVMLWFMVTAVVIRQTFMYQIIWEERSLYIYIYIYIYTYISMAKETQRWWTQTQLWLVNSKKNYQCFTLKTI